MLQLLLFLSTRISSFGDSICQFAHGVFALTLFNRTRDFRSTPTLPAGPSLLVDSPIKFPGPSQSWSPRLSDDRSATHNGPDSFIAQGFSRASDILGFEGPMFIKLLIFLLVLSVICMPFVREFGDLFDVLRSWAHSVPASLLASVRATGITKMSHKDEELAKKLDSALQQIKHGSAQIQSLSAENRALTSLTIGQGADIRTQSDFINQLQGQLRDQGHNLEQAVSYWEQCERDVLTNSQEVACLEERLATLAVDSDINRRHAQAREDRLRSALHTIEIHLSETQTSLRVSRESSLRQHEFFSCELETYAKQLDHWKTAAEQFETKVLESERDMLDLRKELGVAYRNAREAKEQLESQTITLGECDATIRSLDRELADVRDQVQDAQYEIEGLRSDLESVDDAWKPLDSADAFGLTDKLPAILEWRGWLTEGTPDAPAMFVLRPQLVPHSPGMSIEELICASSSPSSQSTPAPSTEILSCSNIHVIRHTDPDDPFVDNYLPQPCSQLSSLSHTPRDVTTSFAASQSHLNNTEIIDELREQLADEQLTRALIEDQVHLLQMKVLATEAVVVVQRRQLSSQQFQVPEEAAKNASLCEESRSLVVERNALAAKITVLEAGLVERQAEEMAAAKAVDKAHAELEQAKETLCAYVNEVDAVKMERDELDMRLSQAIFLSSALQDRVATLEQNIANAVVTPSDGPHDGHCGLERAIFLSSTLQDRVETPEQKIVNAAITPSDGPHESDCSLELVVSGSIPYLLDMSLPSLSSWGSVSDHPLSNPNPKLQPAITASKSGPRSRAYPVPRRVWSPRPITPARNGCLFDGLVPSESSLSLLLASTPPMPLPGTPPVLPSPRFVFPHVPSPCPSPRSPRPEDISPMPILGRVGKRRSPPPPPTFRPPRPMGRRIPAPH